LRAGLDELADLIPVALAGFEQRQDQELGAAFFEVAIDGLVRHRLSNNI
jgi:hypothetical protein